MQSSLIEYLKLRTIDNRINVNEVEDSLGIKLPPIFRVFIETYVINESTDDWGEKVLIPASNEKIELTYPTYLPLPEEVVFYNFCNIYEANNYLKELYHEDDDIWQLGVLPIGECASGFTLLLGIAKDNQDHIIFEAIDNEPRYTKLSNNIFEFARGVVYEYQEGHYVKKYVGNSSNLYKNWNEDFWRIRTNTDDLV